VAGFILECMAGFVGIRSEIRRNPATDSDLKPASVPI
jgi:hypothetical protein